MAECVPAASPAQLHEHLAATKGRRHVIEMAHISYTVDQSRTSSRRSSR